MVRFPLYLLKLRPEPVPDHKLIAKLIPWFNLLCLPNGIGEYQASGIINQGPKLQLFIFHDGFNALQETIDGLAFSYVDFQNFDTILPKELLCPFAFHIVATCKGNEVWMILLQMHR